MFQDQQGDHYRKNGVGKRKSGSKWESDGKPNVQPCYSEADTGWTAHRYTFWNLESVRVGVLILGKQANAAN